jgi:tetrahydromethanopterin S-methyltransferase subunit G
LDSIDQRVSQVVRGLDQLKRIVDRLDQLNERVADLEVTG